mmetsp:Transcript_52346/g.131498  ORF Transcript_52346/g.131498 Transcript_52346/m.131498 type:complete len:121 (-) Transcript_52346:313-675(-)
MLEELTQDACSAGDMITLDEEDVEDGDPDAEGAVEADEAEAEGALEAADATVNSPQSRKRARVLREGTRQVAERPNTEYREEATKRYPKSRTVVGTQMKTAKNWALHPESCAHARSTASL